MWPASNFVLYRRQFIRDNNILAAAAKVLSAPNAAHAWWRSRYGHTQHDFPTGQPGLEGFPCFAEVRTSSAQPVQTSGWLEVSRAGGCEAWGQ